MRIEISTLGIGQQGNQSFAIYNMTSYRLNANGEQQSCWNVLRRYSDFHTFHSVVEQRVMMFCLMDIYIWYLSIF